MKPSSAPVVDTTRSPFCRLHGLPISSVRLSSGFLGERIRSVRRGADRLLELLEEHGVVDNFRRVSGRKKVPRRGALFTDSDLYKWMEAASFYIQQGDRSLAQTLDTLVEVVSAAQQADGYLNTYFVDERAAERFTDFANKHELYCAGHLIQAAVAHHRATGDKELLHTAIRFADLLAGTFGPGRREAFSGHPEVEMALVELYRETGNKQFLDLAGYLLSQIQFEERDSLDGHAVRACYACCGAADYFAETGDEKTWSALIRLWTDLEDHKMYVTGGVGSRHTGESFGERYEIPNLRAYCETCAAIGLFMWAWRMLCITGEARYADTLERCLYNGIMAGVSLSGDKYFYVNPLECSGASEGGVAHERKEWYDTTCCPTNLQRLVASLPGYLYAADSKGIWFNLYQESSLTTRVAGSKVQIEQQTNYPWDGNVKISVKADPPARFSIHLRIPSWCRSPEVVIAGRRIKPKPGSFYALTKRWEADTFQLRLPMEATLLRSHHRAREDFGCAAILRGPLVYCVESVDNPSFDLLDLFISPDPHFSTSFDKELLGGVTVVEFDGAVPEGRIPLYRADSSIRLRRVRARAIPYFSWQNRGRSSMLVWIPRMDAL